jgi:hypothetical protein
MQKIISIPCEFFNRLSEDQPMYVWNYLALHGGGIKLLKSYINFKPFGDTDDSIASVLPIPPEADTRIFRDHHLLAALEMLTIAKPNLVTELGRNFLKDFYYNNRVLMFHSDVGHENFRNNIVDHEDLLNLAAYITKHPEKELKDIFEFYLDFLVQNKSILGYSNPRMIKQKAKEKLKHANNR